MRAPLLATLLLLALPARAAVDARVTPELTAGGGWGSAIYVGDDQGAGLQSHLTPGLAFDLSTGPVVKIFSAWRTTFSFYARDRRSILHDGSLAVRLRLSRPIDLELRGAAESADFRDAVGTLAGDAAAPPSSHTVAVEAGPLLRWRLDDRTTAEGTLDVGRRSSEVEGAADAVEEYFQRASLGVVHRFHPRVEASVRWLHVRNRSDDALWTWDGDGGSVSAGWAPWGDLILRGWAGVQWNRFEMRVDRYAWLGAGAQLPIFPHTTAELAWWYGENQIVDNPEGLDWSAFRGNRHVVWSGLRLELPWWL